MKPYSGKALIAFAVVCGSVCAAQSVPRTDPLNVSVYTDIQNIESKKEIKTIGLPISDEKNTHGSNTVSAEQHDIIVDDPTLFWSVGGKLAYVVTRGDMYVLRYGDMDVFQSPFPIQRIIGAPEGALYVYSEFTSEKGEPFIMYFDGKNQSVVPGRSLTLTSVKGDTIAITSAGVFWQSQRPQFQFPKDRYIYAPTQTQHSLAYLTYPFESRIHADPPAQIEGYVGATRLFTLPIDAIGTLHVQGGNLMYTQYDQKAKGWRILEGKDAWPDLFPGEPWFAPYQILTYTYPDRDNTRWIVHGKSIWDSGYHATPFLGESDHALYWIGRKYDSVPVDEHSKVMEDSLFKDTTKLLTVYNTDTFYIDFKTAKLVLGKPALVLRSKRGRGDAVWYNGAVVLKGDRIVGIAEKKNIPVALIKGTDGYHIIPFKK